MSPKDILGVVVRGFALYIAWLGLYDIFYSVVEAAGYAHDPKLPALEHLIFGVGRLIVGNVIIMCANGIVDFTYGQKNPPVA